MESHNPFPVAPTGFLVGSYFACALYGIHLTQIHHYFSTYNETWRKQLLVLWVWLLSTCQMIIIFWTGWRYFAKGTEDLSVWGEFLFPLSLQDALIPLMAYTAQLYFGRRAWTMLGRKRWIGALVVFIPSVTLGCGIALAVTARLWADNPFVTTLQWAKETQDIGTPSVVVALTWMGLSAATDGLITFILIYNFRSHSTQSPRLVSRLISLTLETVLLTHICGGTMCIIYLASPPAHRTDQDIFWILLEIITELYALSILFTINARRNLRKAASNGLPSTNDSESMCVDFGASGIERRVEGYQGSTPFGVRLDTISRPQRFEEKDPMSRPMAHNSSSGSSGSETKAETPGIDMAIGQRDYAFLPSVSAGSGNSSVQNQIAHGSG